MMTEAKLNAMADDIATNGQQSPILKNENGAVIDGRNRLVACQIAGVEPEFETVGMTEEATKSLIVSMNIMRRHLTPSQRSVIAAQMVTTKKGGDRTSKESKSSNELLLSQHGAAELLDVSVSSVKRAQTLINDAPEALVKQVRDGKLSVSEGTNIVHGVSVKKKQRSAETEKLRAGSESMRKIESLFEGLSSKAKTAVFRKLSQEETIQTSIERQSKEQQRGGLRALEHASSLVHDALLAFDGLRTQYMKDAGWLAKARHSEEDIKVVDGIVRVLQLLPERIQQAENFINEKR